MKRYNALETECRDYVLGRMPEKSKATSKEYLKRLEKYHREEWYKQNEQGFIEGKKVKHIPVWALTADEAAVQSDDICDSTFRKAHRDSVLDAILNEKPVPDNVILELKRRDE
jgi:hypothetical protein